MARPYLARCTETALAGYPFRSTATSSMAPVVPGQYLPAPSLGLPGERCRQHRHDAHLYLECRSPARAAATGLWSLTSLAALPVGPDFPSPCTACIIDYPPSGGSLLSTSYAPPSGHPPVWSDLLLGGPRPRIAIRPVVNAVQFLNERPIWGLGSPLLRSALPSILSGNYATLTIYLTAPAPTGGAKVSLSSSDQHGISGAFHFC